MASSSRIILAFGLAIILASSLFPLAETQTGYWTKDTGIRLARAYWLRFHKKKRKNCEEDKVTFNLTLKSLPIF